MQEEKTGIGSNHKAHKVQDARFHLANERTLLAWIRTSIGVMAFGFVVVKFSLFLKQLAFLVGKETTIPKGGYSSVIGILLVVVGAAVLLLAFAKFRKTERMLLEDSYKPSSKLVFAVTIALLVMSLILIFYLFENSI